MNTVHLNSLVGEINMLHIQNEERKPFPSTFFLCMFILVQSLTAVRLRYMNLVVKNNWITVFFM